MTLANAELSNELRTLRSTQRNLAHLRSNYVDLFDFAPVTYVLLNSFGIILNLSEAGCRLLGYERGGLSGHPLLGFVAPQDRREFLEHMRRCRQSRETVETELRLLRRDGQPVICRLYSKVALHQAVEAFPTIIVDQTENRALDQARLTAEREKDRAKQETAVAQAANQMKDRFLATVSHELRTPLAPALIAAGRLASWDEIPESARRLAATIKRNIELEARLIDDLLDIARVTENRVDLRTETVDLHQILRETINICSPLAELKDARVTMHQIARAHYVSGDAARLRQVFWNLLNNAIKFVSPRGAVVIRSLNVSDTLLRVTVTDDGAGMDADMIGRLFAPFEQKLGRGDSRGGLGLGLAICKGIVSAHGGQIWATSAGVGKGSTFGVELATVAPVDERARDADPQREEPRSRPQASSLLRRRLLLVEDDADSGEMMASLLRAEGIDVVMVTSLESALERLGEGWDILLSDIKLPDGSGLDVARHARRLPRPPACLVAVSGFGSHADIEASREAGFDAHLIKPVDPEQLLSAIRAQVPEREGQRVG